MIVVVLNRKKRIKIPVRKVKKVIMNQVTAAEKVAIMKQEKYTLDLLIETNLSVLLLCHAK
jgi:hypothetical protein